jgi:hypothetical protein
VEKTRKQALISHSIFLHLIPSIVDPVGVGHYFAWQQDHYLHLNQVADPEAQINEKI